MLIPGPMVTGRGSQGGPPGVLGAPGYMGLGGGRGEKQGEVQLLPGPTHCPFSGLGSGVLPPPLGPGGGGRGIPWGLATPQDTPCRLALCTAERGC